MVKHSDIAHGYHVFRDGSAWCAVGPHFQSLATDSAGFGDTPEAAVEAWRQEAEKYNWREKAIPKFEKFTVHD